MSRNTLVSPAQRQIGLHQLRRGADGFRLIAEALDPVDLRLAPKPGQLPLGIVTVPLLGGFDGCGAT